MPIVKSIAIVVTLAFCFTFLGLAIGLGTEFKKDKTFDAKKKNITISAVVFLCLTCVAYKVMDMIPMGAP